MNRRRLVPMLKTAGELGNYSDAAVIPAHIDPQMTLSRNGIAQPFFQIFEKDTVLTLISGKVVVRMQRSSVNTFTMETGDHVYLPAGTPHRIEPDEEAVTVRYMARDAGLEAAAWYCSRCTNELYRLEWEHDNEADAQRVYAAACIRFNAKADAHTCGQCGLTADSVDLDSLGWSHHLSDMQEVSPAG
jgi:3-hydroxyanthranilate 3,4-dioxygenase